MKLRLYPTPPPAAVEREPRTDVNSSCTRCSLREGVKTVCMAPEGDPGGLLVVSDYPAREEDQRGRPMVGETGRYLRKLISQWWTGPVAIDNALKCALGARVITDTHVNACRTYLAAVLHEVKPTRVLVMGHVAAQGVLDRSIAPFGTRRGHAWLGEKGDVPAFLLPNPVVGLRNRFIRLWLEADVQWALQAQLTPPSWKSIIAWTVDKERDAEEAVESLSLHDHVAWDVETAGAMHDPSFRILCLAAWGAGTHEGWVWTQEGLANAGARRRLLEWLEDETAKKVGQNLKFDMGAVYAAYGVMPRGLLRDARLVRKLLEAEAPGSLDAMSELVGFGGSKQEMRAALEDARMLVQRRLQADRKAAKARTLPLFDDTETVVPGIDAELDLYIRAHPDEYASWAYALVDKPTLYRYCARDAFTTEQLVEWVEPQLQADPELLRVWNSITGPAAEAVAQVEAWGIGASRAALEAFDAHLVVRQAKIRAQLDTYAQGINWNSPSQVATLLYKTLGLPFTVTTCTGQPSTGEEALTALKHVHPLPSALLEHREVEKLRCQYAKEGMLRHIRYDGRIHPSLLLDGAGTGRTSCQDPNLQNVPRAKDSPEGKMARDVFIPSPGNLLVELDFSQLELRVAAALSGDPEMAAIFASGADYHLRTAQLISKQAWGFGPEKVEDKHRTQAKTINFALVYGMGDEALAAKIGISMLEARRVREAILGRFRVLASWMEGQVSIVRKTGESRTYWDGQPARRRHLYNMADQDKEKRSHAERQATNTPVQGTASDFCIASLAACVNWIREDAVPAKLVLPVHDSLLFDVREDAVEEVVHGARRIMTSWPNGGIPLEVDVKVGLAWGSLAKYPKAA